MSKMNNKINIKDYIEKINKIDINKIVSSLNNIKVDDIKKIDLNKIIQKVKSSPAIKPFIGITSASILFSIILLPSLESLIYSVKTARQYQIESSDLESKEFKLKSRQQQIKKLSLLMSEIDESILKKDKLIFITQLINATAEKSNVEINSFLPVDQAKSAKLCQQSNRSKSTKRTKRKTSSKKGSFQDNFYEITLKSDYLNIIDFLKVIQYYDVTIIPHCLEVQAEGIKIRPGNNDSIEENNSMIIPLLQSGLPANSYNESNKLSDSNSYGLVNARLVLKIPSHSR